MNGLESAAHTGPRTPLTVSVTSTQSSIACCANDTKSPVPSWKEKVAKLLANKSPLSRICSDQSTVAVLSRSAAGASSEHVYAKCVFSRASVCGPPSVTEHWVPSDSVSLTPSIATGTTLPSASTFGLNTVIVPSTVTLLTVPASCETATA